MKQILIFNFLTENLKSKKLSQSEIILLIKKTPKNYELKKINQSTIGRALSRFVKKGILNCELIRDKHPKRFPTKFYSLKK